MTLVVFWDRQKQPVMLLTNRCCRSAREALGANVIQTFAVSCNGYAWYKGGVVPQQPGLKHDFLAEVVRLGHAEGMRVMGYFCVGANTRWGRENPDQSYGTPSQYHIPLTTGYLEFLCESVGDALKKTGMDGFMIDWVWNPRRPGGRWLDCEKVAFRELVGRDFPGERNLAAKDLLAFERKAIDRAWERIHGTAKRVRPDCVIWLSCNKLCHPTVVGSKMFRQIDWLMNEAPDPRRIDAVRKTVGPRTRLVQCLVGWGDRHDAGKVLSDPAFRGLGIYGFAKPGPSSFPGPIERYMENPISKFRGNDRNIAVLARYYNGLPLAAVCGQQADGSVVMRAEDASVHGRSPVITEGQIGHWGDPKDHVSVKAVELIPVGGGGGG